MNSELYNKYINLYQDILENIEKKEYNTVIQILEPVVLEFILNGINDPLPSSLNSFFSKILTSNNEQIKWNIDIRLLLCNDLINCYLEEKNLDKAKIVLEFITNTWTDFGPAYVELGKLYLIEKDFISAYQYLKQGLMRGEKTLEVYSILTFICSELELYNEVINYGEQALNFEVNINTVNALLTAYTVLGYKDKIIDLLNLINGF